MIICHGTLSTPPEHADAARGLLRQIAQATRNEPGCTLYLVSEDLERPGHFLFAEHWNAMADLQTHLALPGVGEAVAAAHSLGATDLTITAYVAARPRRSCSSSRVDAHPRTGEGVYSVVIHTDSD